MPESLRVILSSEVYGAEVFERESVDEAVETVRRLVASCIEHFRRDGISRQVVVEIAETGAQGE